MKIMKTLGVLLVSSLVLAGCKIEESSSEKGEKENEETMQRARSKHPTPEPNHFLTREAVVKWMEVMDTPGKTFYVYLLGNNGNAIGYYVAQTRPVSACTSLTPPDKERDVGGGTGPHPLGSAPGLDGVYHAGQCDSYFFFTAETDAYVEVQGLNFFVSDQPLALDAEPIEISR